MFQEYSFQITLRQQWNDKRLRFKEKLEGYGVEEGKKSQANSFLKVNVVADNIMAN